MTKSSISNLRADVGQLLLMGFDGVEADVRLRRLLTGLQPGGVILFARNIEEARQTHSLLRECQEAVTVPLFRCVDMEGGIVDRLKHMVAPAPSAAEVAATGKKSLFREHGQLIGEEVRALGFNTDFAPVFDLALPASRAVMGTRSTSPDPHEVTGYAREFLRGLREARVLGCGKHFPGLGEGTLDSHAQLPVISKPWRKLWEEDLVPYRRLRSLAALVMVAHAAYPGVTGGRTPASLSAKWMRDILRKKIGYRGLIVSDDLEMGGVLSAGSIEEVAVRTVEAGADMFLVCHHEEQVARAHQAVLLRAQRDARFARRVREAAQRVLAAKARVPHFGQLPPPPTKKKVEQLRRALERFSSEVRQEGTVL